MKQNSSFVFIFPNTHQFQHSSFIESSLPHLLIAPAVFTRFCFTAIWSLSWGLFTSSKQATGSLTLLALHHQVKAKISKTKNKKIKFQNQKPKIFFPTKQNKQRKHFYIILVSYPYINRVNCYLLKSGREGWAKWNLWMISVLRLWIWPRSMNS